MKKIVLIIFTFLLLASVSFSQLTTEQAFKLRDEGFDLYNKKQYSQAIEKYEQASKIFLDSSDLENTAFCYEMTANVYFIIDKKNTSEEYYIKALNIYKKIPDKNKTADTYINLGDIFFDATSNNEKDLEKALKYYEEGLKLHKELNLKDSVNTDLEKIKNIKTIQSVSDLNKVKYDSNVTVRKNAVDNIEHLENALKKAVEKNDRSAQASIYYTMAVYYLNLNEYKKTSQYLLKSADLNDEIKNY